MPDCWFFISYARLDRDEYLKRFYNDLCRTVRQLAGLSEEEHIGFFDAEDIEPGEVWPERLAEGLRTSRLFVPLYSPTYFNREYCGKEWQVFRSRLDACAEASDGQRPPLILPVLWLPLDYLPKALPDAISEVQYTHDTFGNIYATEGLRYIMTLSKYHDEYQDFLGKFAKMLLQKVYEHPLSPIEDLKPIKEIESAFHSQISQMLTPAQVSQNLGPRYVQFIFVAGRRDELRALRQNLDFYGEEGGLDWRPYQPDVPEEIGIIAQEIASREKLRYEAIPLDTNLMQKLRLAQQQNKLVVILVDTWTLLLEQYREFVQAYDGYESLNCILMILWNSEDVETMDKQSDLKNNVVYAFPTKSTKKDPRSFMDQIDTIDDLSRELSITLNEARMNIVRLAEVIRQVESKPKIPKPTISASLMR